MTFPHPKAQKEKEVLGSMMYRTGSAEHCVLCARLEFRLAKDDNTLCQCKAVGPSAASFPRFVRIFDTRGP